MKPKHTILFGLSIICLSAATASAQQGERRGPPGAPGGEGAAGGRIAEFIKKADANSDGKISKEEFLSASAKEAEERFAKIDANSDGSADMAEISQLGQRIREGAGGGRPGGGAEGADGGFRRPPVGEGGPPQGGPPGGPGGPGGERPQGGPPGGPGGPGGERPQGGPPGGPGGAGAGMRGGQGGGMVMGMNPDDLFTKLDKNSDGGIDLSEFGEPQKAEIEGRFKKMDENSDGKVTKEEMKSSAEKMRAQMMQRGGQGGMRGPGAKGGPGGGEGGFRRPPAAGGEGAPGRPRPEVEGEAPKKETGI